MTMTKLSANLSYDGDMGLFRDGALVNYVPRYFKEIVPVLRKPDAMSADTVVYRMYRDPALPNDGKKLKEHELRYDITIIPPMVVGDEFLKTLGHYHPKAKSSFYPELYEVISGRALYLMQKTADDSYTKVREALAVVAEAGDMVLMPPGYGHITVNIGNTPLVMSNAVEANFKSVYQPYVDHKGAVYYVLADNDTFKFLPNPAYGANVPLGVVKSNFKKMFKITKPLYDEVVENPAKFDFLVDTDKYNIPLGSLFSPV